MELSINDLKQLICPDSKDIKENKVSGEPFIGEYVIIRTYSAGVFAGTLEQKAGKEVILSNARRLWRWHAKEGVSLSSVAVHGINTSKSKICEPVDSIWLEAIEIIPTSKKSQEAIEGAANARAQ